MYTYNILHKQFVTGEDITPNHLLVFNDTHDFFDHESLINEYPYPPYVIIMEREINPNGIYYFKIRNDIIEDNAYILDIISPTDELEIVIETFLDSFEQHILDKSKGETDV